MGFFVNIWVKCVEEGHKYPSRCFARFEKLKKQNKQFKYIRTLAAVKGPKPAMIPGLIRHVHLGLHFV